MKNYRFYIALGIALLIVSSSTYLFEIFLFHKPGDTIFYFFQDLAFVPIQALLVMLIIDRLLQRKEKAALLNKLNMMIGVFFNEMGAGLMSLFFSFSSNRENLTGELSVSDKWSINNFNDAIKKSRSFEYQIAIDKEKLAALKSFMADKQEHMNRLLENPNLLEHESFTDLLWAVFHISDELFHRTSLQNLPGADIAHLRGDIVRAYKLIVIEWLTYMKHLKQSYPYLFSIAVRTNPFNPDRDVIIS